MEISGIYILADSAFYLDLPFKKITLFILCGVTTLFVISKILRVFWISIDKSI